MIDGDHVVRTSGTFDWNQELSTFDIDNDGQNEVEELNALLGGTNNNIEFTRLEELRWMLTHEIGHAIGMVPEFQYHRDYHCKNPNCVNFQGYNQVRTPNVFGDECRTYARIHND